MSKPRPTAERQAGDRKADSTMPMASKPLLHLGADVLDVSAAPERCPHAHRHVIRNIQCQLVYVMKRRAAGRAGTDHRRIDTQAILDQLTASIVRTAPAAHRESHRAADALHDAASTTPERADSAQPIEPKTKTAMAR